MSETGNREYKSDVFCMLMDTPEYALEVYNALNNTHYNNPEDVQVTKLESSFSLSIRNDASFIIDATINLYEHQSSYCPNMPLRNLLYFSDLIRDYVKDTNLYRRTLVKIPTPHFVVFYNGMEPRPDIEIMYLSSAFMHTTDEPELELKCTTYNINMSHNHALLENCPVLKNYMIFIDMVRNAIRTGMPLNTAIEQAIDFCIQNHILEDFFRARKTEVTKAMTLDYTIERQLELNKLEYESHREEWMNEARSEGLITGRNEGLSQGLEAWIISLKEFLTTPEEILARIVQNPNYADVTLEQVQKFF
ncbi:MAG: hypothetical protein IJ567_10830 [Lachnospiraceae bacterium]|nr:hypothetical protein [Lachnospiraceae bacterium]